MIYPNLHISEIKSLRFRGLFLFVLALPALTGLPFLTVDDPLTSLLIWASYSLILQLIIIADTNLSTWLAIFSVACLLSLITGISGAVLESVTGGLSQLFNPNRTKGLAYLRQIILMLAVIPLALFTARSLPPAEILERIAAKNVGVSKSDAMILFAIRMLNHVTEVVVGMLPIWREEMPSLIKPRFIEVKNSLPKEFFGHVIKRTYFSIKAVCLTLLIHSLQPLPLFHAELCKLVKDKPVASR